MKVYSTRILTFVVCLYASHSIIVPLSRRHRITSYLKFLVGDINLEVVEKDISFTLVLRSCPSSQSDVSFRKGIICDRIKFISVDIDRELLPSANNL
jgi:hypothetical protein